MLTVIAALAVAVDSLEVCMLCLPGQAQESLALAVFRASISSALKTSSVWSLW